MKASELIAELQKLMIEHGDLEMYTTADHDWLSEPYFDDWHWCDDEKERIPRFRMDSEFRAERWS